MKKILFLLFCYQLTYSQNLHDVDKIIFSYPTNISVKDLSNRIDYDFKTDIEKVRAIYTWLSININYAFDYSKLLKQPEYFVYTDIDDKIRRQKKMRNEIVNETLRLKKSQCTGYAYTFKKICDQLKIKNKLILGYAKVLHEDINRMPKYKNHVWNAVKINKNWIFIDATWGSEDILLGPIKNRFNDLYFNPDFKLINLTHFPSSQKWRKYAHQKTLFEFSKLPIYSFGYLKSAIEIIAPQKGEIIISSNNPIALNSLNKIQNTTVLYCYNDCKKFKTAIISNHKNNSTLLFDSPNIDSILKIFFNQKLALQYKIVVK